MSDKECNWAQEDDDWGNWETDCGQAFILNEGTPSDNRLKFCCYCGKPLTETIFTYPEDEQERAGGINDE